MPKEKREGFVACGTCDYGHFISPDWRSESYEGYIIYWDENEKIAHHCKQPNYVPPTKGKTQDEQPDGSALGNLLIELDKNPGDEAIQEKVRHQVLQFVGAHISSAKGAQSIDAIRAIAPTIAMAFQAKKQDRPGKGAKCPTCQEIVGGGHISVNISPDIAARYLFCQTCPHFEDAPSSAWAEED